MFALLLSSVFFLFLVLFLCEAFFNDSIILVLFIKSKNVFNNLRDVFINFGKFRESMSAFNSSLNFETATRIASNPAPSSLSMPFFISFSIFSGSLIISSTNTLKNISISFSSNFKISVSSSAFLFLCSVNFD